MSGCMAHLLPNLRGQSSPWSVSSMNGSLVKAKNAKYILKFRTGANLFCFFLLYDQIIFESLVFFLFLRMAEWKNICEV